ncbi:MAG TPA: YihY/virulence factor BrkB family protein, partial [Thermoleophilaceae bacterium]|nr:YihY/virulence factor BrkB family protein [Thermoleophilaceae bacterium]
RRAVAAEPQPAAAPRTPAIPRERSRTRRARALAYAKDLYWKGYEDNVTGLSGMVAYNLLLSLFPLALIALFVTGSILQSESLEARVVADLRNVFPSATEHTIDTLLRHIRDNATSFGLIAVVTSIWFGASFWGALDTAFCRIYHVECRRWVEQKRFALIMLVVVLLLMLATVAVPAAQGILVRGAHRLPFGLADVNGLIYALTLAAGLAVLFGVLCLIYLTVPNRLVPWRGIWPGALAATIAMGIVDYVFPVYLGGTPLRQVGTTVVFVVILLIWFYALAFIILGGALINAHRFEAHDTGQA